MATEYRDEKMTPEDWAYDRAVREAARLRAKKREWRQFVREDACKRLTREIEKLKTAPFSWQVQR